MMLIISKISFSEGISWLFKDPSVPNIWIVLGFFIILFHFVLYFCKFSLNIYISELLWFLFIMITLVRNADIRHGNYNAIILYTMTILMMLMLLHFNYWFKPFINTIKFFCICNALATIIFWLNSSLYWEHYHPSISALIESNFYTGYRSGLAIHYSTNGIYLSVGLLACTACFSGKKFNKIDIVLLMTVLFALALTTKRAHLLFSIMAIIGAYYLTRKEKITTRLLKILITLFLSIVLLFVTSYFIPEMMHTVNRFFVGEGGDITNGRITLYQLAINTFLSTPSNFLFGIGWGGYKYIYNASNLEHIYNAQSLDTHNVYLQLLCEIGLVGTLVVLSIFLYTLFLTIGYYRKRRHGSIQIKPEYEAPLFFALTMQLFFFLYSITGGVLYVISTYLPYFFSCAIVYSMRRIHANEVVGRKGEVNESLNNDVDWY